ncbi:PREDICTED: extracellular calcium-sensing receptor-like [Nanorana parkeri]|uniref:extracellular calcium-sensing receptor-like n=1 Tax=Nanorana parkeri TaxID=125878 RepID=UPI000854AD38|nr:PREDICTED: extracellular calcium-sensing receptor-like [Nanorana parkeri]
MDITQLDGVTQPGDIMFGVLLPLHLDKVYQKVDYTERPPGTTCTMFHFENYQQFQSILFAVEEINSNPSILSNLTLGFQAYDSCDVLHQDLQGTLELLSGSQTSIPNYRCILEVPLSAVIGPSVSTHSILVAHILGLYRFPQISHFSTSPILSDRTKFPSFFRTVSSDIFQSQGLAQLVLQFGWTWVGLLAVDNDYGQQGIQLVRQALVRAKACVAFSENIITSQPNHNAPHIVDVIKSSTVKVVVAFSPPIDLLPILDEMLKQNITEKMFVASEAWSTSSLFSKGRFSRLLNGTIGLTFYSGTILEFGEFLNNVHPSMTLGRQWAKLFWEEAFNCKFIDANLTGTLENLRSACTGMEDLRSVKNSFNDVSALRATYNVYTAVHVIAKALEDLKSCKDGEGPFPLSKCADILGFKPWQLLHYMKKVRVKLSHGRELYFDQNGDPPAVYDIVNWQLSPEGAVRHVKIGSYDTTASRDQVFTINTSAMLWTTDNQLPPTSVCSETCPAGFRRAAIKGQPMCCFQCIPCPLGEISNHTDSIDCIQCPWDQWPNSEKNKCLQKTIEYLSYEDALGATLTSTSLLSFSVPVVILQFYIKFKITPIVKANNYYLSCLLLVSLSLCFLCSLSFIGYPDFKKCLLRQIAFGLIFAQCISCILAKTIMVVLAFIATKPGSNLRKWTKPTISYVIVLSCTCLQLLLCLTWLCLSPPYSQYNIHVKPGVIIVECNEGSDVAFWAMLGYLFLLATISFIVAFLARRLPDSFNEAQFITFSMVAFLSVWISFIPAYQSAQGKYIVAMEIFAILASSWALVIFMFLPKCLIIWFKPDRNTRAYLMRKC